MSEKKSELVDIKGLWRLYKSKWLFFLISVLVCGVVGVLISLRILPKYEVKASLMLNQDQPLGAMLSGGLSGVSDLLGGNTDGADEVQIIQSHALLSEVSKRLGLSRMHYKRVRPTVYSLMYDDYPIDIIPGDNINIDTLTTKIECVVEVSKSGSVDLTMEAAGKEIYDKEGISLPYDFFTKYGKFTIEATDHFKSGKKFKNKITISSNGRAAEDLRETVSIGLATKNSQIVELLMYSENRKYAVDVLNTIMAVYIERGENKQKAENEKMVRFLQNRADEIRLSLTETEKRIADIKESAGLTAGVTGLTAGMGGLTPTSSLLGDRLNTAETAMTTARVNHEIAALTLRMVTESAQGNSLIPFQGDTPELVQLISEYNNLILRRQSVVQSAREDNSALQRLDEQITAMRQNLLSSLQTMVDKTAELQKEYEAVYKTALSELDGIPQFENQLYDIYRTRTIEEQVYIFLMQKMEESAMLLGTMDSSATVIDPAYALDEDQSFSPILIVALAVCFGLLFPPLWLYIFKPRKKKSGKKSDESEPAPAQD